MYLILCRSERIHWCICFSACVLMSIIVYGWISFLFSCLYAGKWLRSYERNCNIIQTFEIELPFFIGHGVCMLIYSRVTTVNVKSYLNLSFITNVITWQFNWNDHLTAFLFYSNSFSMIKNCIPIYRHMKHFSAAVYKYLNDMSRQNVIDHLGDVSHT